MGRYALALGLGVALVGAVRAEPPPEERVVGSAWQWFTDYAYFSSEWTVNASPGCDLEVGFGMKVGGKPRGGIHKFQSYFHSKVYGIGAVHVRRIGGDERCLVRVELGDVGPITIYSDPSVLGAAWEDVKATTAIRQKTASQ